MAGVHPAQQREEVVEIARSNPRHAFRRAMRIEVPWYAVQGFSWVARFAPEPIAQEAFDLALANAAKGHDTFQRTAVLAWPLRAAIETGRWDLARSIARTAVEAIPGIANFHSRAETCDLIFQSALAGPREIWEPVLIAIQTHCPTEGPWRSARLYRYVTGLLAAFDKTLAEAFVDRIPAGKTRERCLKDLSNGLSYTPRSFYS